MRTMLKAAALCLALADLGGKAWAQEKPAKKAPRMLKASSEGVNLRVSFKMKDRELESAGNFVVQSGAQANYVIGSDTPSLMENRPGDKGVEFKKHTAIVNCVLSADPAGARIAAECQFELSGPLARTAELRLNPSETFQFQTSFTAEKGKTLVLVDEPERHLEVMIDRAAP